MDIFLEVKRTAKPVAICIAIALISGYMMNVCVLLSIIMGKQFGGFMVQLMNKLAIVFALIVIPFFLYKKILNVELDNIKIKYFDVVACLLIGGILFVFFKASTVLHYLIIAIAEEVHFRKIQFDYLKKQMGIWMTIIISSIIFSFIFHLNDSFVGNLVIRFPLGIILGVIRLKFGLNKSIFVHWIYDVVVSVI